jgi:hypothetical protein
LRRTNSAGHGVDKAQRAQEMVPPPLPPNKPKLIKRPDDTVQYVQTPPQPQLPPRKPLQRSQSQVLVRHTSAPLPQASLFKRKPCRICGEFVDKDSQTKDASGKSYHKDCFRCLKCKLSQTGKRVLEGDNLVVGKNDCLIIKDSASKAHVLCDQHAPRAVPLVAGTAKETPAKNEDEIRTSTKSVKEKMTQAKESMEMRAGDSVPMCSRCGLPIEKDQDIQVAGMQRFHVTCPTKEQAALATKNTRMFLKKTPERLVALLTCDAEKKDKYSFMFQVDSDSLARGLRKNMYDDSELTFMPDVKARASVTRKLLVVPTSREFDVHIREYHAFAFVDPTTQLTTTPVVQNDKVIITKYFLTNGVLIVLEAVFKYDESTLFVAPEKLVVKFQMYPPRTANEDNRKSANRARSIVDTDKVLKDYSLV